MDRFKTVYYFLLHQIRPIKIPKTGRVWIFSGVGVAVVLILLCSVSYRFLFSSWVLDANTGNLTAPIHSGMSLVQIADSLYHHGILKDPACFITAAKWSGMARKLKAGTYQFQGRQNNYRILRRLVQGDILLVKVTLREGIWARNIAALLAEKVGMDPDDFMLIAKDPGLCQTYGIEAESLEGYLYPDTYYFHQGLSAKDAIHVMVRHFFEMFSDTLEQRASQMNMTVHEVVTLASIIEGEAVLATERPLISALYHNRLKRRMLLQADPTIQYLIPDGPRRLLKRDLEIQSPYNTYQNGGLPPGPVNNPGILCILAALYPADAPYLYMVANGDGSHTFSNNMDDHLHAKRRFDRIRRNVSRKKDNM